MASSDSLAVIDSAASADHLVIYDASATAGTRDKRITLGQFIGDVVNTSVIWVDANFEAVGGNTKRYNTITAALAVCTGGETIIVAPGTYTENVTFSADGVTLMGSGMPHYDSVTGRLVGGTILRGRIDCASKVGVVVQDLGVDQVGTASNNCITASALTSNTYLYQTFRNLAILGNGSDYSASGTAHGIESNGGCGCTFDNLKIYHCTHGLAILGSHNNASNIYAFACGGGASVIVKSKLGAGNAEHVNITNVVINGETTTSFTRGGPIIVQVADSTLYTRYVNVSNVTAINCVNGVVQCQKISTGTVANMSDISFVNVVSKSNQDLALVGDFWIETGTRIRFTNCSSVGRLAGYGWEIGGTDYDAGIVELVACGSDSSGSGDYSGAFTYVDINGTIYPLSGLALAKQVDYRGEMLSAITPAAAISVTAANTPVAKLSDPLGGTNDYAGLLLIWVRNGTASSSNSALWTVTVMKGNHGGVVVFAAELSQLGPTGTGASAPNFTWAVDGTNNHLEATPTDSASGSFYFSFAAMGYIKISSL